MELELRFFANFRTEVGEKTISREYEDETTVGEILAALEEEFSGLEDDLLDDGQIREHLSVLKNGRDVVHMAGVDTVMEDGDRLSVFPPVAGGAGEPDDPDERGSGGNRIGQFEVEVDADGTGHVRKSYRGISERLALEYLGGLGGERTGDSEVTGDGWRASTTAADVSIYEGSTMQLTEVTVSFEGAPETLEELVPQFSRKAMRAGG